MTQTTNPLGRITLSSYDLAGNLIQTAVESNNPTVTTACRTEFLS